MSYKQVLDDIGTAAVTMYLSMLVLGMVACVLGMVYYSGRHFVTQSDIVIGTALALFIWGFAGLVAWGVVMADESY